MAEHSERYSKLIGDMGKLGVVLPEHMAGFGQLHHAAAADGALTGKMKELITLGIAISVRCAGCITCHVKDAITAGANRDEIIETIGVAIMMGGGPSVVYGAEAMDALDEFAPAGA